MSQYDWSRFVKRIPINTTQEKIYRMLSTPDGLEKWFLRKAEFTSPENKLRTGDEFIQIGDRYEWTWHGYPDSMVEHGEIVQANGKDFLQFTFGKAGTVSFKTYPGKGMIVLEVLQENIPTDDESKINWHIGCMTGWLFYLVNIKSILEGGLDLRNKNVKLQEVINA